LGFKRHLMNMNKLSSSSPLTAGEDNNGRR
jgi:hypothetical protein